VKASPRKLTCYGCSIYANKKPVSERSDLPEFLRRHFFFALAGTAFVAMFAFVLLKEVGLFGKPKLGGAAGASMSQGKGGAGKAGSRPTNVTLAKAEVRLFSDRVEIPGTALANESIVVTSKVQDIVDEVRFESGQNVERGAILIVLARTEQSADLGGARNDVAAAFDDADGVYQEAAAARAEADAAYNEINAVSRDLEAARAGIAEAEAVRSEAKLNFDRVTTLADRGFASKARLDSARAQLQSAESRFQVAKERSEGALQRIETQKARANALTRRAQSVDQRARSARARAQSVSQRTNSVQSRLSDRIIRAPFSGRVGLRTVSPGQLARPGDVLATLDDISQIKVDFDVPETRINSLQVGTEVAIRSTAIPDQLYKATVRFVDTRIDPRSRSIRARAYISNSDGRLRPGMLMSVNLITPDRRMPAVPEVALLEEGNASFVFIAQSDGKDGQNAKRVPVSIGMRRDGFAEIMNGLPADALVITEGLVGLRDGQAIKPVGGSVQVAKPADSRIAPSASKPDGRGS
jgi:membrane fusion protein (multidrug efflux system)